MIYDHIIIQSHLKDEKSKVYEEDRRQAKKNTFLVAVKRMLTFSKFLNL